MRGFTWRGNGAVRLAAVAGLVVAFAGCSEKKSPPTLQQPATWSISGTVSGAVSEGVTVKLLGRNRTATTNTSGFYEFTGLTDGTYTVEASLVGYSFTPPTQSVTVTGADVTGRNFTSLVGIAISGTVAGEAGAGVIMTLTGPVPAITTTTVTTTANGSYAFSAVVAGIYSVTPSLAGWTFAPANSLVTVASASVTSVNFTAAAVPHAISGKVTGAVLAGVTITLSGAAPASTVTDVAGNYSFTGLPNGTYTATPSRAGYAFGPAEASVTLQGADSPGVDFVAVATHRIAGTISGDVLEGVKVTLSGADTDEVTTDAVGHYEFTALPDGVYVVTPSLAGYAFDPESRPVTLAGADVTTANFTATLVPTYSVSGTVSGATGVTVSLSGAATATTTSDVITGAYSFTGLYGGSYMVIPSSVGFTFTPASRAFRIEGANVTGQNFTAQ